MGNVVGCQIFLIPTHPRGGRWTQARPYCIPTLARGNEEKKYYVNF